VVEDLMDAYSLEPERFRLVWCSSAEADKFVAAVTDMTEAMRGLGPNPYRQAEPEQHEEVA
jgi:F420-non-reducing hydrogenase iron-sulfur subunit